MIFIRSVVKTLFGGSEVAIPRSADLHRKFQGVDLRLLPLASCSLTFLTRALPDPLFIHTKTSLGITHSLIARQFRRPIPFVGSYPYSLE